MSDERPIHLDLFSGCGGFALAAERAGFRTVAHAEIEDAQSNVLRHHWPAVPNLVDVRSITRASLADRPVLITGGFPCQDLSVAGNREGLAGARSGLWFEFHRIIGEFQPRWVVIENVPGLLSSNDGLDFALVLGGIAEAIPTVPADGWGNSGFIHGRRYNAAWRVLDAQYAGLAQRRERVFIIASLGDGCCAEVLFEPESLRWNPPPSRQAGQRTAATLRSRTAKSDGVNPPGRGGEDDVNIVESVKPIADTLTHSYADKYGLENQHIDGGCGLFVMSSGQANAAIEKDICPSLTGLHEAPVASVDDAPTFAIQAGAAHPDPDKAGPQGYGIQPDVAYTLEARAGMSKQQAVAFKPSHYTRDKDGAPSDTVPPLSAEADKGDQEPVVFESRHYTRGQGGPPSEIVPSLKRHETGGQGDAEPLVFQTRIARNGRGQPEKIVPALNGSDAGATSDMRPVVARIGMAVRRLTPRECERLQGFPDDWTARGTDAEGRTIPMSDSARYRMLGNAVAVPVVEWILARIISKSLA